MIPAPDYLKQYASEQMQKGNLLSFRLKCSCGCELFTILENSYTNEETRRIKEYEDSIPKTGLHTIYGGLDSNGNPYQYIRILGIFKKHITFPQIPVFMGVNVVKAICSHCQREILLFDSRYHGYDAMISDNKEVKKYIPVFKQRGNIAYGIEVTIENEPSLQAFTEALNEHCSYAFYSNSFHCIRLSGLDRNGKKKLLYAFETA